MPDTPPGDVTLALQKLSACHRAIKDSASDSRELELKEAQKVLFEIVYDEVRKTAASQRFVAPHGHTFQLTAVAAEAYVQFHRYFPTMLRDVPNSRRLFFDALGRVMFSILRDHSRKGGAGGRRMVALGDQDPAKSGKPGLGVDAAALSDAIERLNVYNARWGSVVHYRFFAGLTTKETAEIMGVGETTVKADWRLAQTWLARELREHVKPQ